MLPFKAGTIVKDHHLSFFFHSTLRESQSSTFKKLPTNSIIKSSSLFITRKFFLEHSILF